MQNSSSKESHIIEAAIAYLSRNPGSPLEDIVQHADIRCTTLFRYFSSRAQRIQKIILEFDWQIHIHIIPILDEDISAIEMLNRIIDIHDTPQCPIQFSAL